MRVCYLKIENFRGIKTATILLPKHAVVIGDNNVGKTTILEALNIALGPDRLNRFPPIDEHDFFRGQYLAEPIATAESGESRSDVPMQGAATVATDQADKVVANDESAPYIEIEATIADLSGEQKARFGDYLEFWDSKANQFYVKPDPEGIDSDHITEALRVTFRGWHDRDEDDFQGKTYFTRSLNESDKPTEFRKRDKQVCGFLYLRSLRTGNRALSLERGSLLDVLLRLREIRPQMWEHTINELAGFTVAANPELGISGVLKSINAALKKYVPKEWGIEPHLKVSNLTREHLRKVVTAFIATGNGDHVAPFYRQGSGTINMLVLAMLSEIADGKQNVIFAMEEPETAIPPYAQKCIVHEIRSLASQAIFTSHSPYILEEFTLDETVVLDRNATGELTRKPVTLPPDLKLKTYRQEFRTRFCEGLLSRRVLIVEGQTEATAFPVVCRRLAELNPIKFKSLEALGICTLDAGGETKIAGIAEFFRELGKRTFALCDKQEATNQASIENEVELLLMHDMKGFEKLVLDGTTEAALQRFASTLEWPPHLAHRCPSRIVRIHDALADYFSWAKGNSGIADFIAQCSEAEIPEWLQNTCEKLMRACDPVSAEAKVIAPAVKKPEPRSAANEFD